MAIVVLQVDSGMQDTWQIDLCVTEEQRALITELPVVSPVIKCFFFWFVQREMVEFLDRKKSVILDLRPKFIYRPFPELRRELQG